MVTPPGDNYEPGGREFESLRARHLNQLVTVLHMTHAACQVTTRINFATLAHSLFELPISLGSKLMFHIEVSCRSVTNLEWSGQKESVAAYANRFLTWRSPLPQGV